MLKEPTTLATPERVSAVYFLIASADATDEFEPVVERAIHNFDDYCLQIDRFCKLETRQNIIRAIMVIALAEIDEGRDVALAVKAAVTVAKHLTTDGIGNMVNAVLRRLCEQRQRAL